MIDDFQKARGNRKIVNRKSSIVNTGQIPRFDSVLLMLLTIWTSCGWDFSKPSTDDRNPSSEWCSDCGFCCSARGFVGRNLRETGDALRLLVVRFGKLADLGFQRAEQLEQFAFAVFADGFRAADFRLNFVQICFRS